MIEVVLSKKGLGMGIRGRSDEELLTALMAAVRQEADTLASVLEMLIEVEDRLLHVELASPTMFDFCVSRLRMSESEAYRRTTAARLARRFPKILDAIRAQQLHLTNLLLIRNLLADDNWQELLSAVDGRSKREVEELVARRSPKPDVPARIVRLPEPRPAAVETTTASVPLTPTACSPPVGLDASTQARTPPSPTEPVSRQVTPLSESRYRVQFTASAAFCKKVERARALMKHRNIRGDIAVVLESAIDALIVKLEKERFAAVSHPRKRVKDATPHPVDQTAEAEVAKKPDRAAAIAAAVRREVVRRDQEQCTYVSPSGERCASRELLEIDHRNPRALGGTNDVSNLRLLCRAHNQYAAAKVFGRDHVERAVRLRRSKKERTRAGPSPPASSSRC